MGIAALHPSYALAVLLLQNRLRANIDLCKHFNVIWVVQPFVRRYSPFVLTPNQSINMPSRPARGALAIVTNAWWDAVDAKRAADERA